jgi:hypothetical protein
LGGWWRIELMDAADDVIGIGYGEWLLGRAVSGERDGPGAAVGPQTSRNHGTLPVTRGQEISRS